MSCIETHAQPGGDQASVLKAWGPGDCKEVCGVWPALLQLRGAAAVSRTNTSTSASVAAVAAAFGLKTRSASVTAKDCENSCANFKDSLSSCVANILFEPGKVASMGMPEESSASVPSHCSSKDTPCLPALPVSHQKCIGQKTKATLNHEYEIPEDVKVDCDGIEENIDYCKDCPQMKESFSGHFTAYVGGCMSQLHTYYAATDPANGNAAVSIGESGCKPHL